MGPLPITYLIQLKIFIENEAFANYIFNPIKDIYWKWGLY